MLEFKFKGRVGSENAQVASRAVEGGLPLAIAWLGGVPGRLCEGGGGGDELGGGREVGGGGGGAQCYGLMIGEGHIQHSFPFDFWCLSAPITFMTTSTGEATWPQGGQFLNFRF